MSDYLDDNVVELPLALPIVTFDEDMLKIRPQPKASIGGYFPIGATTALVASGGVGKTVWITRQLIDEMLNDRELEVMVITKEDAADDYQNKLFNDLHSFMPSTAKKFHNVTPEDIANRFHVMPLKGTDHRLIASTGGLFVQTLFVTDLKKQLIANFPRVRLVVFETLSRFGGGEEMNEHMEAVVSACDGIAIAIRGASVVVHHTGKAQARADVVDLYAGRGGSALGDNCRSNIVIHRLKADDGVAVTCSPDDLDKGRVIEVIHVRHAYAPEQPSRFFVIRGGEAHGVVLEEVFEASPEFIVQQSLSRLEKNQRDATDKILAAIKASEYGRVEKSMFEHNTQALIGLPQKKGRALIKELVESGVLVEWTADGQTKVWLRTPS
jgi:hypothetical protein